MLKDQGLNALRTSCLLSLPFAVFLSGCGKNSPDNVRPRLGHMVAEKYAAYQSEHRLPAGAGVLVHLVTPDGSWTACAGLPAGADENWHYRIASVSKTFTAAAIMLLDQQGKLRIDDKLTDPIPGTDVPYLADSPNYAIPRKREITIRELLSHRAGVFDVFNDPVKKEPYDGHPHSEYVKRILNEPDHQFTTDELAGVVASNQLRYSDGERKNGFKYSDTGYSLLGKIIERVSGKSYDRFLAENLFAPADLSRTSAPWSPYDSMPPEPFLPGYARLESDEDFVEVTECNMSDQIGPGNIVSTAADMGRWIRALLSGKGPLCKEQVARMTSVPEGNTTYALGIGNSEVGAGHSGAHPGYVNLVAYHPADDVTVVVVTPFIDYSKLPEQLAFITGIAKEARRIAGFQTPWPVK